MKRFLPLALLVAGCAVATPQAIVVNQLAVPAAPVGSAAPAAVVTPGNWQQLQQGQASSVTGPATVVNSSTTNVTNNVANTSTIVNNSGTSTVVTNTNSGNTTTQNQATTVVNGDVTNSNVGTTAGNQAASPTPTATPAGPTPTPGPTATPTPGPTATPTPAPTAAPTATPSPTPTPTPAPTATPTPAPLPTTATVRIYADRFDPAQLDLPGGSTVVFVNETGSVRTATGYPNDYMGNSGAIQPGDSWSVTFANANISSRYYDGRSCPQTTCFSDDLAAGRVNSGRITIKKR